MLTVIITVLVALFARQLKTVMRVAIIAPIVLGFIFGATSYKGGGYYLLATLINIPVDIIIGYFVFKYAERKLSRKEAMKQTTSKVLLSAAEQTQNNEETV